ncbi:MAG: spore germination protein [Clostridiales bacterium]|nr:spore germination protein [Clostridiales bacterium]
MKINENLQYNQKIVQTITGSDDIVYFEFLIGDVKALAIYVDSITDKETLGLEVISPLRKLNPEYSVKKLSKCVNLANVTVRQTVNDCIDDILAGKTAIFIDGKTSAFTLDLKKFEVRAIAEPPTGLSIKGPRNGFNESIKSNLSLIRRYIKSSDLKVENFSKGRYTKTDISLVYIEGIVKPSLVQKIRKKLEKIDIDGIPDSSYVAKILNERKTSLFKQTGSTERPDVLMERILEGRVAILVDGSPFAITLPYLMLEDLQASEDYYISTYRANLVRSLRIIAILFSIFLPGLFVAVQLFHLQLIPLNFLLTIVNSIKEIPLSPSLEMFFVLMIFEILNETSVRMPKYVGMALAVVGALVLGETAVNAGIVSTPAILIMALSGISIYAIPELVETTSVLRLICLVVAGSLGAYGMILYVAFIMCYLCSMDNYGVPYTAPYSPFIANDLQDGIYMDSVIGMSNRPIALQSPNKRRQNFSHDNKQN